ncbi:hypothetical protein HY620_02410 [Candidatus Uhrbacteria bacterium]|nr:hypothetical protein [Candidatus Uhrbacteria bacterium]
MQQIYAELTLYFGYCNASTFRFGEGRFDSEMKNERAVERYKDGLKNVLLYLEDERYRGWGLTIASENIVETEDEARTLIEYAEKNIRKAARHIELVDSCHGVVRFYRKIRFYGYTADQKEELINKLKASDFSPDVDVWDVYRDGGGNRDVAIDKKWNTALTFIEN